MTNAQLREHYAGLAMQALLTGMHAADLSRIGFDGIARQAWEAAEAMLKAKPAKKPEETYTLTWMTNTPATKKPD